MEILFIKIKIIFLRFWYKNLATFKPEQLTQIKQATLGRILCDNGDNITKITENVFILPSLQQSQYITCDKLPTVDLRFWYECEGKLFFFINNCQALNYRLNY